MTHTFYIKKGHVILFVILMYTYGSAFSQQKNKPNKYYKSAISVQSLDSVLPIDDIQSITVTNYSGTHILTMLN